MRRLFVAAALLGAVAALLGGCADSRSTSSGRGATLTVYVSVPLHGQRGAQGRAVANGARLALAASGGRVGNLRVRGVYLDDSRGGRWSAVRTAANARRAAEDVATIGYIGELDSGATRVSLPITNQAEIAQVAPGATAVDLTHNAPGGLGPKLYQPADLQSFARVVPDDEVQAGAGAVWAKEMGATRVAVVNDGSQFSRVIGAAFSEAARRLGVATSVPIDARDWIYYAGTASALSRALRDQPDARVLASDALLGTPTQSQVSAATSPYIDPTKLPPAGQRFVRTYRRQFNRVPDPPAAYGYESMALLLDAIRRAGDSGADRNAVIDEVLSTRDRRSVLGTYSIDSNGDTTLRKLSGYRIAGRGRAIFDAELEAPR